MIELDIYGFGVRILDGGKCEPMDAAAEVLSDALNSYVDARGGRHGYLPGEARRVFEEIIRPAFPRARITAEVAPASTRGGIR